MPVGLVKANTLYYVHTDHLGRPRSITNGANAIVWKWNNTDPFGSNLPSTQTIEYNNRFPGQYFDFETKLHYNCYRTYNALIGRYIQSDPLGLAAGFNTYSYVGSNPLGAVDPLGLDDNRVQFSLQQHTDWSSSDIEIVINSLINLWSNSTNFKWEEIDKRNPLLFPTNPNLLTIGGHGSWGSLAGNRSEDLTKMIIEGRFIMKDKSIVKNNLFQNKMKNNEDINIKLEACSTGITIASGYNYAADVASKLREYAKLNGYKGKITIIAPNGLSRYNHFTAKESVILDDGAKSGYGRYKKIPQKFEYLKF